MATVVLVDFTTGGSHNGSYLRNYACLCIANGAAPILLVSSWTEREVRASLVGTPAASVPVYTEATSSFLGFSYKVWRKVEAALGLWKHPLRQKGREKLRLGQIPSHPMSLWLVVFLLRLQGVLPRDALFVFLSVEQMLCKRSLFWRLIRPPSWAALMVGTSWIRAASVEALEYARELCISDASCLCIATLTEQEELDLSKTLGARTSVVCVPESVNLEVADVPSEEIQELVGKSAGRKIVLLTGLLSSRKCVLELVRAWNCLSAESAVLLLAGRLCKEGFDGAELHELERLVSQRQDILLMDSWIDSEADVNWLITRADAVVALYRDFQGSSNIVAKAASFGKPVLALSGSEIGRRVAAHSMGVVVDDLGEATLAAGVVAALQFRGSESGCEAYVAKYADPSALRSFLRPLLKKVATV